MKRAIVSLISILAATVAAQASPVGTWSVAGDSGEVQIKPCGKDLLCGTSKGATIFNKMKATEANTWTGVIIDIQSGDKYDGTLSMVTDRALKVRGCIQGGGMCGDQTWTRLK